MGDREDLDRLMHLVRVAAKDRGIDVYDVEITTDVDELGERVFNIRVIFSDDDQQLAPKKTIGLARDMRENLEKLGESGLPILSFVAEKEIRKSRSARR